MATAQAQIQASKDNTLYENQSGTSGAYFFAGRIGAEGGTGFYTWGSTNQMIADVQNWLENPQDNFGLLVLGNESSRTTAKRFDSKDNCTTANRPVHILYLLMYKNCPEVFIFTALMCQFFS